MTRDYHYIWTLSILCMEVCDKGQNALDFVLAGSDQEAMIKRDVEENGEAWNNLPDSSLGEYFGNNEGKKSPTTTRYGHICYHETFWAFKNGFLGK